jgi:hypothetical protein
MIRQGAEGQSWVTRLILDYLKGRRELTAHAVD